MSAHQPSPEELAILASTEPPITPRGLGKIIVVLSIIFLVFSTIVIFLRVFVRGWILRTTKAWGHDDTLAVLGYVRINYYLPWHMCG